MMRHLLLFMILLVSACASSHATQIPYMSEAMIPPGGSIEATVSKPSGVGPFPAVILLHGCGGINPYSMAVLTGYADHFNAQGYVTVIADSFSQRTKKDVCEYPNLVSVLDRTEDAYSILRWLNATGYVIPNRVALLGQSHGGGTILAVAEHQYRQDEHFAGGIALYPWCPDGPNPTKFPLLVLIGGLDSWTPAGRCTPYAERVAGLGHQIEYHVYPNAAHAYDMRGPMRVDHNHLLGWNGEAALDTSERIDRFLATVLK